MPHYIRRFVVIAIFCCLAFVQPAQSIAKISKAPVNDVMITAVSYSSEVSAAHITAPTTFPIQSERKADSTYLVIEEITTENVPLFDIEPLHYCDFESAGFLSVRKYQSNYLPANI